MSAESDRSFVVRALAVLTALCVVSLALLPLADVQAPELLGYALTTALGALVGTLGRVPKG